MSDKDYTGIVICGETVSIDIMLPESNIVSPTAIKEMIEKELKVKGGDIFIPFHFSKAKNMGINFGEHGRRWHVRVVVDMSQIDDFYNSLRIFCKNHGFSFNGVSPPSLR